MVKIAILKPDYGVFGGFERVVTRIQDQLAAAGYDVTRHTMDLAGDEAVTRYWPADRDVWRTNPEFARYLFGWDQFDGIHSSAYDLVLSTSPPSYVHRHPAHLALFYHHQRVFYDLEDLYLSAGFAADPEAHRNAAAIIRDLDHPRLEQVHTFLCPSATVRGRLERFNGPVRTKPFHAGVGVAAASGRTDAARGHGALSAARHEFPKRTELLVAAAHLLDPSVPVVCTGTGGRLAWAQALDARLGADEVTVAELTDADLWCNTATLSAQPPAGPGRTRFVGQVDDDRLDRLYEQCRCVVAPAYDEDYGLTAIEAMAHGRPVVVCTDGGGLAELVEHGETGLVVAPEPTAIAAAIARLHDDPDLANRLGANGRDRAASFTWARAARQLLEAVESTLDSTRPGMQAESSTRL